jgi:uncharacterized membrane protein SpoIIM required for sporulation
MDLRRMPEKEARARPVAVDEVDRFAAQRQPDWKRLSELTERLEAHGPKPRSLSEARSFARLYRAACADLLVARAELMDAALADYLDALVARAYAFVYAPRRSSLRRAWQFVWDQFPGIVRGHVRLVALAGTLLLLGASFGAFVVTTDPAAVSVVVPDMHLDTTPTERVHKEELVAEHDVGRSAVFSSFLFTHNIQVTFLVFALGITFGIGTAFVLFWNGIPLGALAAQYHASGQGLFFWAWILPHGVVEITVVLIAGASGFVLAKPLWLPGTQGRGSALRQAAPRAVSLVLGGMPMLVVAGLVEGTISQMHAPLVPPSVKLGFAAALFCAMLAYLRRRVTPADGAPDGADD